MNCDTSRGRNQKEINHPHRPIQTNNVRICKRNLLSLRTMQKVFSFQWASLPKFLTRGSEAAPRWGSTTRPPSSPPPTISGSALQDTCMIHVGLCLMLFSNHRVKLKVHRLSTYEGLAYFCSYNIDTANVIRHSKWNVGPTCKTNSFEV